MNPRGWSGVKFGNKVAMGTLELRLPAASISVVEILKIFKFGHPTLALISDFGNAWEQGQEKNNIVITAGAELKFSFSLGDISMLIFTYGWAQSPESWGHDLNNFSQNFNSKESLSIGPKPYLRLSLINPF